MKKIKGNVTFLIYEVSILSSTYFSCKSNGNENIVPIVTSSSLLRIIHVNFQLHEKSLVTHIIMTNAILFHSILVAIHKVIWSIATI